MTKVSLHKWVKILANVNAPRHPPLSQHLARYNMIANIYIAPKLSQIYNLL